VTSNWRWRRLWFGSRKWMTSQFWRQIFVRMVDVAFCSKFFSALFAPLYSNKLYSNESCYSYKQCVEHIVDVLTNWRC
jgi:hypothetical protein